MRKLLCFLLICALNSPYSLICQGQSDYIKYHSRVSQAEKMIIQDSLAKALEIYAQLFQSYDFIFLRDYQVASQVAWKLNDQEQAVHLIKLGISSGWKWGSLRRNQTFKNLRKTSAWKGIRNSYDSLQAIHSRRIDQRLRAKVRSMSLNDQKKALGALFRIGQKAKIRYAESKFAPNNEAHVLNLGRIINEHGYPGEKLIGYDPWAYGILIRHNSISKKYNQEDTLYHFLKPKLLAAVRNGFMPPQDLALIEDWRSVVSTNWKQDAYGYMIEVKKEDLTLLDQQRASLGLRSITLRNELIDVQKETGMDFYLPLWPQKNGKIKVHQD